MFIIPSFHRRCSSLLPEWFLPVTLLFISLSSLLAVSYLPPQFLLVFHSPLFVLTPSCGRLADTLAATSLAALAPSHQPLEYSRCDKLGRVCHESTVNIQLWCELLAGYFQQQYVKVIKHHPVNLYLVCKQWSWNCFNSFLTTKESKTNVSF